jgi:hypothetical protein
MTDLLLWVSRKSSLFVLAMVWALALAGALFVNVQFPWPVRLVGTVLGIFVLFGYPLLIIFGFPARYSTVISRGVSIAAVLTVVAAYIASIAGSPTSQPESVSGIQYVLGFLFGLFIFSPFVIATHVLGEARRSLGVYKPLDSIGAFTALLYFAFGGVFFVRAKVSEAVERIAARSAERTQSG